MDCKSGNKSSYSSKLKQGVNGKVNKKGDRRTQQDYDEKIRISYQSTKMRSTKNDCRNVLKKGGEY